MANKTLHTRIKSKTDTIENWGKATGFNPLRGELTVHEYPNGYARLKVGLDGETNINNIPFVQETIDVIELPTTNIQEDFAYRLLEGKFITRSLIRNDSTCYLVDWESPPSSAGESVFKEGSNGYILTGYYNVKNNVLYGYFSSETSTLLKAKIDASSLNSIAKALAKAAVNAIGTGWKTMEDVLKQTSSFTDISWGGVVSSRNNTTDESKAYLYLSYNTFIYRNGVWVNINQEIIPGEGIGAEVFNSSLNTATGAASHSEGFNNKAIGAESHAEGHNNEVSGYAGHVEGSGNTVSGSEAHGEGGSNTVSSYCGHVEGSGNNVSGSSAHGEGANNIVSGNNAHVEGAGNESKGNSTHVEGGANIGLGNYSHIEGYGNKVTNAVTAQHIQGKYADTSNISDKVHVVGWGSSDSARKNIHTLDTSGKAWFAGDVEAKTAYGTTTLGATYHLAEEANYMAADALNDLQNLHNNVLPEIQHDASEASAMADSALLAVTNMESDIQGIQHDINEGIGPTAYEAFQATIRLENEIKNLEAGCVGKVGEGANSVVFNDLTNNRATGKHSFVEGNNNLVDGNNAHAEGASNESSGNSSHVEGGANIATGNYSHTEGYGNKPTVKITAQHIQGKYADCSNISNMAHVVGWGSEVHPANIHTLDAHGNAWFAGRVDAPNVGIKNIDDIYFLTNANNESFYRAPLYYLILDGKFYDYAIINTFKGDAYATPTFKGIEVKTGFINSREQVVDWYTIYYNVTDKIYWCYYNSSWYQLNNTTILTNVFNSRTYDGVRNNIEDFITVNTVGILETFSLYSYNNKLVKICENKSTGYFAESFNSIDTKATGNFSHAEGVRTWSDGYAAHAEGDGTIANGPESHAEGGGTQANGWCSHAEGYYTVANGTRQHVQGKYNIIDNIHQYAHIVGNGEDEEHRSNCHTLDWNGNAWFAKSISIGGAKVEFDDTNKRLVISFK